MKKLDKTIYTELEPTRLFLGNLEKIENLFIENVESFTIETQDYEYSSIDELKSNEKDKKIKSIKYLGHNPYLSIEFTGYSSRFYSSKSDLKYVGMLSKVREIINSTKRKPAFIYSISFYFISWVIFQLYYWIASRNLIVLISFSVPYLLWTILMISNNFYRNTTFHLVYKENQENFFVRNKDQLIILIIGAIIGAALTFLINKFILQP